MHEPSKYLTDRQVAERYAVHRNTIHRWARERDFPKSVKLGDNCKRWRIDDLENWEARQEVA
ncbi:AlpA family phage regulatory protein [Halomonas sp. CUBES01]|uniref:helix-turn-helix transcriptional regulator n=1 Tax=Halomonas sp. CUBES01 TaxID=2897340 RepID=UPI001E5CC88E|nr:AlpA family phage regulatory protein [Halomonas sp. CUBES01]MEC4766843.1 AlpA family phage regulatory protein [Halomonas sp. CUBES01]